MPIININGTDFEFENGLTLIQACEQAGVEIPRFCYHERLEIAGNCRMCLVEQVGAPKPIASCAIGVNDLRPAPDGTPPKIRTDSALVKKARAGVMEFLLINHPLDCPICDQAGECDLQDQAMYYGDGKSRYDDAGKRAVEDKHMGPLIKTSMTRCIHCTRCVRFMEDVAGVPELGATGRGETMEVTTYIEQGLHSEMSGNIIDLCPVGALTSKPYAFAARPWELKKVESVDVMDAVGSNIRIDVRGNAVLRVLPRLNEAVNEEWISDKTRFACDGLSRQRLDVPYVRKGGKLQKATWEQAFAAISEVTSTISGNEIAALAGNQACVESMFALRDLMHALGSDNIDCRQDGAFLPNYTRGDYLFNSGIAGIDEADFILIVGSNPRIEAPIINARIRKRHLKRGLTVANIGNVHDLTYPVQELGDNPQILLDVANGKHKICTAINNAKKPMIIVGMAALSRVDGLAIYDVAKNIAENMRRENWNAFNVLHNAASRVGGLDIGFVPNNGGKDISQILGGCADKSIKMVYLLGADEIDPNYFANSFVIYQGSHGDIGAARADVILPASAYTEKDATYVNLEGRVQRAAQAAFPPNEAKEDWRIVRALAEHLGINLEYNNLGQLRQAIASQHPHLSEYDNLYHYEYSPANKKMGNISSDGFIEAINNFYMTCPISRNSVTMAACTRELMGNVVKEAA
jgi:NADH-quinone oxidoreductase subunit G